MYEVKERKALNGGSELTVLSRLKLKSLFALTKS